MQIGKPIKVTQKAKADITDADIDLLHTQFVLEMRRLFERTKAAHGVDKEVTLQIL